MLVLDAIKFEVAKSARGHLDEGTFELALIKRGLSGASTFTAVSDEFELATADVYKTLATAGSVSEGGYKISISDTKKFRNIANAIYRKHGEPEFGKITVPRGKSRQQW